jgi:tetratricopeptide (TPR) repeat protein
MKPVRSPGVSADSLVTLGREAAELRRYSEAREYFEDALRLDPSRADAERGLGKLYITTRDYPSAIECFSRIIDDGSGNPGDFIDLALAYERSGQTMAAENTLERASAMFPESASVAAARGVFLIEHDRKSRAESYLAKAWRLRTRNPVALRKLADVYLAKRQWKKALEVLRRYASIRPKDFKARMDIGFLLFSLQEYEASLKQYRRAANLNPKSADARIGLAKTLEKLGRTDAAISAYRKALENGANAKGLAPVYTSLANLLNRKGRFKQSIKLLERAKKDYPENAGIDCAMGVALAGEGRYREAIAAFESALDDPRWNSFAYSQIQRLKQKR